MRKRNAEILAHIATINDDEPASVNYDALPFIAAQHPDGRSTRPTDADYVAYEAWVIERYGQPTWDALVRNDWAVGDMFTNQV